jgi:hypothetical protein
MTDNKQFQHVQEASWDMLNSLRETNQTIADAVMTIQDHNLRFTHSILQTWIEMLTPQSQSTPYVGSWEQPTQQQDACQRLLSTQRRSLDGSQSEVAALRARLDKECEAYSLFCNGFAMTASHTAITKRMQAFSVRVGEIHTALVSLVEDTQATKIIRKAFEEKVT